VPEDQGGYLKALSPMTPADKRDERQNKRLNNALKEDRGGDEELRDTLAAQLAGAVFEVAHNPEKTGDLSKFRGAVTKLIERGEPDAGRKTSLDKLFARRGGEGNWHPRPDKDTDARPSNDQAKLAAAEIEEFSARDEVKRARMAESLMELRAGAGLSKAEDRALDMYLRGLSLAEIAHHFGSTKTAKQAEQHLVVARRKLAQAAGIAA